jgi:hypothetical protein
MKTFAERKNRNRRLYYAVISSVALSCGNTALAQTNVVPAATNSIAPDTATNAVDSGSSTNVANLGNITVVGQLDQARSQISPDLGATTYTQTKEQIESESQGGNAPMSQVILRAPGVAGDNAASGELHVRGEHANLQYRVNDVLLPEGISGFGLELDPRFVDSMQLITGSLPAQYGFRTAGVVDIQTKSGAFDNGGTAEIYGGSYDTIRPSFELGGSQGKLNYFIDGSYDHNALGIEDPTASHSAIHDTRINTRRSLICPTSWTTQAGSTSWAVCPTAIFRFRTRPGLPPALPPPPTVRRRFRGIRQCPASPRPASTPPA